MTKTIESEIQRLGSIYPPVTSISNASFCKDAWAVIQAQERQIEILRAALEFYGSDSALDHVDDEVKQEYLSGQGWGDFGDMARAALGATKSNQEMAA